MSLVLSLVLTGAMVVLLADATQYNVGSDKGWSLGVNYTEWVALYNYSTGDTLFFRYAAQNHSVLQVTLDNYKSCNTSTSASLSYDNKGNSTFELATAGKYWFICGVGAHCSTGHMKFSLDVSNSTSSSAAGPSPSPIAGAFATPAFLLMTLLAFLITLF